MSSLRRTHANLPGAVPLSLTLLGGKRPRVSTFATPTLQARSQANQVTYKRHKILPKRSSNDPSNSPSRIRAGQQHQPDATPDSGIQSSGILRTHPSSLRSITCEGARVLSRPLFIRRFQAPRDSAALYTSRRKAARLPSFRARVLPTSPRKRRGAVPCGGRSLHLCEGHLGSCGSQRRPKNDVLRYLLRMLEEAFQICSFRLHLRLEVLRRSGMRGLERQRELLRSGPEKIHYLQLCSPEQIQVTTKL